MQKETFRLKSLQFLYPRPSHPRGLSNRGAARCPYDDLEEEKVLIRDILLTFSAAIVLVSGVICTTCSIFFLVTKIHLLSLSMSYLLVASCGVLVVVNVFTLVCFFVFLCGILHNNNPELHTLTLVILCAVTGLLACGSGTMSAISRSEILLKSTTMIHPNGSTANHNELLDSPYKTKLTNILTSAMNHYNTHQKTKTSWDAVQVELNCCGINNYTDWLNYNYVIPESCCHSMMSNCKGCIDVIATKLATVSSFSAGISFGLTFVMLFATIVSSWLWLTRGSLRPPPPVSSVEIFSIAPPSSFELLGCSSLHSYPSDDSLSLDSMKEQEMHVRYYNPTRKI